VSTYSIAPLVTACLFALLGSFVYWRGRGGKSNRAYALWCLTTVYWQFCWTVLFSTQDSNVAGYLVRIGYSGIIFIPIAFYHFNISFLEEKVSAYHLPICYTIGFFLASSVWADQWFLRGFYIYKWGYYPKAGPLHPVYLAFLSGLVLRTFYLHYQNLMRPRWTGLRRTQIKYVTAAAFVYVLAAVDFLVNYGIDIYPCGFIFTLGSFAIVTYSITIHRLMDVTLIIRRTLVYSTVMAILTVIYLGVITIITRLFEGVAGYQTVFSSAIAACLITTCFQPLRKRVQAFVDAKFFRQYVDREEKLYELSREVITHTTPEAMAEALIRVLSDTLHPKSTALYLKARDGNGFMLVSEKSNSNLPDVMPENNPLQNYFSDHPQPFAHQDFSEDKGESLNTRRPQRSEEAA
jgi:two-component system, CAI-1 autoinducer sensor kinase/phosphatase CqsS